MRGIKILMGLLLVTSVFALATPVAAHNEYNPETDSNDVDHHDSDCEEEQPAAGGEEYTELSAGALFVCEGEHWDGDDDAGDQGANGADTDNSDGDAGVAVNNGAGDDNRGTVTEPVRVRASVADDGDNQQAYVELFVFSLGQTGAHADSNDDGVTRVAWYGEDHTPGALLATAITQAGITRGHVDEGGDCDYETYEQTRDIRACGRDNTAITVELTP